MSATLEQEFDTEMRTLFTRTGEAIGYWPRYFLRKVRTVGGLKVAQDLLQPTTKAPTGFGRLADENQLELSVEFMVLQRRWASLFTEQERQVARRRLRDAGFTPVPGDAANDD